jgi:hypothetical protein
MDSQEQRSQEKEVKETETTISATGKPYNTEGGAKKAMAKRSLSQDTHMPVEIDGGWGIVKKRDLVKSDDPDSPNAAHVEKYYRVVFSAKSSPTQPDDVELSVNGETLLMQRDKEIIIPGRYKEVADHAEQISFKQLPGIDRKVQGKIKTFPYTMMGEATREEYLSQKGKKNGNSDNSVAG